jgi:hypothetical protein
MSPDEVLKKVEAEIGGNWGISNHHGVNLRTCLVRPPRLVEYRNSWYGHGGRADPEVRLLGTPTLSLWLVLNEHPETRKGYAIVYDEVPDVFGLADAEASGNVFIGHYGTFLETLEAM